LRAFAHRLAHGSPAVWALSYAQIDHIITASPPQPLQPERRSPGGLLKNEVDAHCCAIAAKRYARYRLAQHSQPKLVSDEEHARFWTSLAGGATAVGDVPCHRDTPR